MTQIVVFPDVEAAVVAALKADTHLAGVTVSTRVPNPRPTEFVRVMRSGGPRETLISENASVIVEGWASSEARASQLLNLVRAVLFAQDGVLFGVGETGGPSNLPDPTSSQYRYTALMSVRVRGVGSN